MVASFNIPYPFVLGEPRSENWNWEVPGETLLFHEPSAFQCEAAVLQSSAARRLLNSRSFARLAIGSTWGSLKLTTSLAPPGRSRCQINHSSMPAPAKRTPGLCPRAGGTPRGAVSKCYVPWVDPLWEKLWYTQTWKKLRLSRKNYRSAVCVSFKRTWGAAAAPVSDEQLQFGWKDWLPSALIHKLIKIAIPELWKIGLKQAWEISFPLFGFIAILYLFFLTGVWPHFFFNSHNGDSTAALDSLVQCISTLSEKIKSLLLWNSSVSPAKGGPGHGY